MRMLLLALLSPLLTLAQKDTVITYRIKEVHNITYGNDSTFKWTIDTIKYGVPFEIKFTKKNISVDGYGDFKVSQYELRGNGNDLQYRWYRLSNGSYLMWVINVVVIEYPVVNRKSKMIVFNIE